MSRNRLCAGAVMLMLAGLTACAGPGDPDITAAPVASRSRQAPSGTATGMSKPLTREGALRVLDALAVKGRAPLTGYTREAFGPDWADVNRNGCDTRNDILARDLTNTEIRNCVVLRGELLDPYSGQRLEFVRGPVSSMRVQIDHVVALANAWQTGAFGWSADKRERFANDPHNLLAVRGDLNMSKGDGDAATWLPPRKSFRCEYVRRQIAVKAAYGLWVTLPEQAAMRRVLQSC